MKTKLSYILFLLLPICIILSSCSEPLTAGQRRWNGQWHGDCAFSSATGAWIDNSGLTIPVTLTIETDQNGHGTIRGNYGSYGEIFTFDLIYADKNGISVKIYCTPDGDAAGNNEISDLLITGKNRRSLNISGTYLDPRDGLNDGFCFSMMLQRSRE